MCTIVQHSGFGYAGNLQFRYGLETRTVGRGAQEKKIRQAGGLIFDSYLAADQYCEDTMYPQGVEGLTPHAELAGDFSKKKIDGLAIFVPKKE